MRLVTHFPSYFLIYDCLCPHPFHKMKKDYRLLPGFPNDHKAVQCNILQHLSWVYQHCRLVLTDERQHMITFPLGKGSQQQ